MQNTMYNNQNRTADAAMSAPASCCAREASMGIILDTAILAVSILLSILLGVLVALAVLLVLIVLVRIIPHPAVRHSVEWFPAE